MHYILEPEVSGGLGSNTKIDTKTYPPIVYHLHFIFSGWLGDELIECFPVYLVAEKLKNAIEKSKLIGFKIMSCEIEISHETKKLQPNLMLPSFFWLKILENKKNDKSDFFIDESFKLCITVNAIELLNNFNISNCDVSIIKN